MLYRKHAEKRAIQELADRSKAIAYVRDYPAVRLLPGDTEEEKRDKIERRKDWMRQIFRGRPRGFRVHLKRPYGDRLSNQIVRRVARKYSCTPRMARTCWEEWRDQQRRIFKDLNLSENQ